MTWETNTGPLVTEEEAWALVDEIMDTWPNTRPRPGTVEQYILIMCRLPKRYVEAAMESLRGDGRAFAPNPGELEAEVRGIWPLKDMTGAGTRAKRERERANGQQQGAGVARE